MRSKRRRQQLTLLDRAQILWFQRVLEVGYKEIARNPLEHYELWVWAFPAATEDGYPNLATLILPG